MSSREKSEPCIYCHLGWLNTWLGGRHEDVLIEDLRDIVLKLDLAFVPAKGLPHEPMLDHKGRTIELVDIGGIKFTIALREFQHVQIVSCLPLLELKRAIWII